MHFLDTTEEYNFWFIVGSQLLYGQETLEQVAANSQAIAAGLNSSGWLPWPLHFKGIVKSAAEALELLQSANYDASCAGVVTFCHTFSPSKMWLQGLSLLQKPWLHLHTQFLDEIPNEAIDMDYMNLHQSAHGDREHGFIGARLGSLREVIAGSWRSPEVAQRIDDWMRAAVGAAYSRQLKVMRFGDNMREVAVTEGDKIAAQLQLGWQVNTWPVGELATRVAQVKEPQVAAKLAEYASCYLLPANHQEAIAYQARLELAMLSMLQSEGCHAFTNTFEDLHGLRQLAGLASQHMMSQGYGYGGEGDWKTAALVAIIKVMTQGFPGGTSFMEDYTYDLASGLSLGAHMLELCPSLAAQKPRVEVHPLSIGGKEPPARLVFEGAPGQATLATLIDMGGRFRLVAHDITCVKPTKTMPNLPVARVMWQAKPNLETGAECWILAGGSHHGVLSYSGDARLLRSWARMMDIEFVHIHQESTSISLERELFLNHLAWKLR